MRIIGQQKLLSKINSYTNSTLPKTMFFCGEAGCGKHHFIKYIAEQFNLDLVEIDENITNDQLIEYSQKAIPTLYIIDLIKFTDKQQNQFLKFIEEPAQSVYTALLASSEAGILPTILNRCIKYHFEPYSPAELKEISGFTESEDNKIYKICNTPGKLVSESASNIQAVYDLCNLLVHQIQNASWSNTLKIVTQINYKENYNKFNFNLFLDTLEFVSFEAYKNEKLENGFLIYLITNKAKQELINKNVAKENFMLNFITKLWKETR